MTPPGSNRQRRAEIKRKRLERAERLRAARISPDVRWRDVDGETSATAGMVAADRERLIQLNNTYGTLPEYYLDRAFRCRDCGEESVWTAKQQKWWFEVAGGHIDSIAVRCLPCRRALRARNQEPGSDLLEQICAEVRALGEQVPSVQAWTEIDRALENKWWGVRVVAIGVLGRWGTHEAVQRLKAYVDDGMTSHRWGDWRHEALTAATKALGDYLPQGEGPWALEHVLSTHEWWTLYLLHAPLARQPLDFWEQAIETEWRRGQPERLEKLPVLLHRVAHSDHRQAAWRKRFENHHDPRVRKAAQRVWGRDGCQR